MWAAFTPLAMLTAREAYWSRWTLDAWQEGVFIESMELLDTDKGASYFPVCLEVSIRKGVPLYVCSIPSHKYLYSVELLAASLDDCAVVIPLTKNAYTSRVRIV